MRYREVKERIEEKFKDLPKNQQKIADFFLVNFDRIPFLSVQEISESTHVSVASIVRFAQNLGFSGFSEIRDEISVILQSEINSNKDLFPLIEMEDGNKNTLTEVANLDIQNINETLFMIDREKFSSAVGMLASAEEVYTAGMGISYLLAEVLSYQLTQVGIKAKNFRNSWASFLEESLFIPDKGVLIVFSFPPYSPETIDLARSVKKRGIKVISITNKSTSPAAGNSDIALTVKSENMLYTNSFAAISVLINAIATEAARLNKKKAKEWLHKLNEIEQGRLIK
ncbi:MAG: MurR/RpiR family transcriptional regulator [Ignavibacteriales bacterium]|jgi:DNA-binding MurR/RpiR family transcriptional regulator|nr:MurR/RpiR family transcriptional regulator [Ignavibacteriales bacterium]MBP7543694.1 MurR/RpiR family transcriptional regulator [Ignavibacteriaceae bacterium]MBK7265127.1 MurR/RpiR family transcriptional regulator [Ignavibacteriales bacterium]MBK8663551.1 MurR/RpiR family transcriptional regulator [Ignavibacteriales bacterium]MBP9122568.1 MurR/RpiR family transcriptional regulator [Ignavibacteriaceae bacterium]